jgi:hypothetical protein
VHSVYDQPRRRVLDALAGKHLAVAAHLEAARVDVLAFTASPQEIQRQIPSEKHPGTPQGQSL